MVPGAREGDRAEHRVDDLVPVGDESAWCPLPHAPGGRGIPGRRPAAAPACRRRASASRRGSRPRQPPAPRHRSPATGPLPSPAGLSRRISPARAPPGAPFFPSRPGGPSSLALPGATGRAPQIASLTSARSPSRSRELRVAGHSGATFPTSWPGRSCLPRPPPPHSPEPRPVAGMTRPAHAQFGFPHLRCISLTDPRRKSPTMLSCTYRRSRSASSSGQVRLVRHRHPQSE